MAASPPTDTKAPSPTGSIRKEELQTDELPTPTTSVSAHPGKLKTLWKKLGAEEGNETQRGMQSRHLMMIAIGGTIGTGIFLSAGSSIALAGPGSTLLSYFVVGVFVYTVVITLGEMSSMYPVSGAFSIFGTRFVSPALGFTLGWNYWLQWSLTIPSELTASAVILQFWTQALQPWHWAIIIIIPMFAIQLIHVRVYGESEYWFALIKVVMIVLFIIVGLIYDWGGVVGHPGPGLANFKDSQAFIGGFSAFAQTFVYAFYSYGGIELVSLAAGESETPYKSVPRAVKATFFRIVIFYILAILTMGLCINWQDESLLRAAFDADISASPITTVFIRAGFGGAAHLVNAVLLTAVLSATNSCFYASSRMLLALARAGHAPRWAGWVNGRGVPVVGLLMALLFSCLTFLTTIWGEGIVFSWLLNVTGISALLVWTSIGLISLRFRYALRAREKLHRLQDQQLSEDVESKEKSDGDSATENVGWHRPLTVKDLPYTQPLFPLLPIGVVVLGTAMFIAQGYAAVRQEPFEAKNVVATYIGVALYFILYTGYSIYDRYVLRSPYHFIPIDKIDFVTDAVWAPGEGALVRERARTKKAELLRALEEKSGRHSGLGVRVWYWLRRHVY